MYWIDAKRRQRLKLEYDDLVWNVKVRALRIGMRYWNMSICLKKIPENVSLFLNAPVYSFKIDNKLITFASAQASGQGWCSDCKQSWEFDLSSTEYDMFSFEDDAKFWCHRRHALSTLLYRYQIWKQGKVDLKISIFRIREIIQKLKHTCRP